MDDYKAKLTELLTTTAKQSASDLHLAVGRRPTLRIDGILVPLQKEPITTPEMAEGIIGTLITDTTRVQAATGSVAPGFFNVIAGSDGTDARAVE